MDKERQRHFDEELLEIFMGKIDKFISFREKIERLSKEMSVNDIFNSYFSAFDEF